MSTETHDAWPGMFIAHRSGDIREIKERAEDHSGWWLTDGSGVSDAALAGHDWLLLDAATVARLFEERP